MRLKILKIHHKYFSSKNFLGSFFNISILLFLKCKNTIFIYRDDKRGIK